MTEFKYIELFAGIGGFRQALDRLGGKCVFASEIDKFAAQAYEVLYGEKPAGDITKIDAKDIPDHDLLTAGFPCQAFSVAGKRLGFEDTRGTLFFEIVRIAKEKRPKVLLLENVKGLVGHNKGKTIETIILVLNDIGYTVDFQVLNSKYFGVLQNRERVFFVCIRDDLVEREPWVIEGNNVVAKTKKRLSQLDDIKTFNFDWPPQTEVTTRLRDILEDSVDERYYLSEERTEKLLARLNGNHEGETDKFLIDDQGRKTKKLKPLDISPTLRREMNGNVPKVVEPQITAQGRQYRIRRLTPLECWRLHGFPDEAHERVKQAGISNNQRYKQAGNAVTVNVVESIGRRLIPIIS